MLLKNQFEYPLQFEDFKKNLDILSAFFDKPIIAEGIPCRKNDYPKKQVISSNNDILNIFCESFDYSFHVMNDLILLSKKYSNDNEPLSLSLEDIDLICKQIKSISEFPDDLPLLIEGITKQKKILGSNIGISDKYDIYNLESPVYSQIIESIIFNKYLFNIKNSALRVSTILKNANHKDSYFIYEKHTNNPNIGLRFHFKYQGREVVFPLSPADILYWNFDGAAMQRIKAPIPDSTDPNDNDFTKNGKIIFWQYDKSAYENYETVDEILNKKNIKKNPQLPSYVLDKKIITSNITRISENILTKAIRNLYDYSSNYRTISSRKLYMNPKVENIAHVFPSCIHSFIDSKYKIIDTNNEIDPLILMNRPSVNYDSHILKFKKSLVKMLRLHLLNIDKNKKTITWQECNTEVKNLIFQILFIDLIKDIGELITGKYIGSELISKKDKYLLCIDRDFPKKDSISLIERQSPINGDFKSYNLR